MLKSKNKWLICMWLYCLLYQFKIKNSISVPHQLDHCDKVLRVVPRDYMVMEYCKTCKNVRLAFLTKTPHLIRSTLNYLACRASHN